MSGNRAIVQRRFAGTGWEESLELVSREVPNASAGTVLIRLTTRSVNPNDLTNVRDNKLQPLQDEHHPVIGSEGCGRIVQVRNSLLTSMPTHLSHRRRCDPGLDCDRGRGRTRLMLQSNLLGFPLE